MKDAIELLMEEHRLIEKGLDALEFFVGRVADETVSDGKEDVGRFVEFIREFADRTHHGKEEHILFTFMVEHGFPKDTGPVAVMLSEHDEGRSFVRTLDANATQAEPWSKDDRSAIASAGRGFVSLLRQHIQKEDNILYPMARQKLPETVMNEINRRCEEFEAKEAQSGENARLRQLGEELYAKYGKRDGG